MVNLSNMGEKCLKQYHTYHECCYTSKIIILSQFSNFPDLGLKYHLPMLQSPVWGGTPFAENSAKIINLIFEPFPKPSWKKKLFVFNLCKKLDFIPDLSLSGQEIDVAEERRLPGLFYLVKISSNRKNVVSKANRRLQILCRPFLLVRVNNLLPGRVVRV